MPSFRTEEIIYFEKSGPENTGKTIELAIRRLERNDLSKVLVATTSGKSGLLTAQAVKNAQVIVVSHSYGFKEPNKQQLTADYREKIFSCGAEILTCTHTFGGVGRAVRKKFGTVQIDEIIAQTLRTLGDGMKVAAEITLMAADAGLVNSGENILAIAGSDHGADTAAVIKAANAQQFFELKVQEIICKPVF
ncbi:MAG: hypothetical protein H8E46_02415 [FCB group bacterium]|nr:hypothetical protein [FCB group bacterium]